EDDEAGAAWGSGMELERCALRTSEGWQEAGLLGRGPTGCPGAGSPRFPGQTRDPRNAIFVAGDVVQGARLPAPDQSPESVGEAPDAIPVTSLLTVPGWSDHARSRPTRTGAAVVAGTFMQVIRAPAAYASGSPRRGPG